MKSAAVIPSAQMSYYMDHLAVICFIMNQPLYVCEKSLYDLCKIYYPQIEVLYRSPMDFSLDFMATHLDLLFVSDKFSSSEINLFLEALYNKTLDFFYCPHGNSDKGQLDPLMTPFSYQKLCFIYGRQMEERLKESGIWENLEGVVTIGNFRREFYLQHKEFYDQLVQKQIFPSFPSAKRTILYAPTWKDQENSTSFFEVCHRLLSQLPSDCRLIVKLHPFLEHYFPGPVHTLKETYRERPNICFLIDFPLVYPLMQMTDLYLGDFSSVGYDYLSLDRPLFFFNPEQRKDKGLFLYQCGMEVPLSEYGSIFSYIDKTFEENRRALGEKRREIYNYAFAPAKPFHEVREEVLKLYRSSHHTV